MRNPTVLHIPTLLFPYRMETSYIRKEIPKITRIGSAPLSDIPHTERPQKRNLIIKFDTWVVTRLPIVWFKLTCQWIMLRHKIFLDILQR